MSGKKRCKNCGQLFDPKGPGDFFCSSLCRTTGKFVGGGGDTTKPMSEEQRKEMIRRGKLIPQKTEAKPKKIRNGGEKYPRVAEMFRLPLAKRWELARTFTAEEQEYCRRVMKRMLMEERKISSIVDWDSEAEPGLGSYEGIAGGMLGESDDGTV